jgi:TetR/AcrR family transcriptional regulator, tetracycline repressor protein
VFADRTQRWRWRVESLALELRQRLSAHPVAVPLMIGGPMDGPHALALNERLLELLADAGLEPGDAARAAYLLIVYVFGSIALEVADLHQPGPLPPESARIATRHLAFAATPAEHYPRTAAAAATLAGYISTQQYIWGLHRILDGITTDTTAGPEAPSPL